MSATVTRPAAAANPAGAMTLDEFFARHGGDAVELVDGVVVEEVRVPQLRHGQVNATLSFEVTLAARRGNLGHVFTHDSFLVTRRDPDRVRGPDLMFVSYGRLPAGPVDEPALTVAPNLAVEVKSPSNTMAELRDKAAEYLAIGTDLVWLIDPELRMVEARAPGELPVRLDNGSTLTAPGVLPGFELPLAKLFG